MVKVTNLKNAQLAGSFASCNLGSSSTLRGSGLVQEEEGECSALEQPWGTGGGSLVCSLLPPSF